MRNYIIKLIFSKYKAEDMALGFFSFIMLIVSLLFLNTLQINSYEYYVTSLICLENFTMIMISYLKLSKLL